MSLSPTPIPAPTPATPTELPQEATRPDERWPFPDVLRGVAILGILCVNMQDFAGYNEWQQRGPDQVAQVLIDLFFNGKFISIFAMLFGAGMALIAQRAGPAWLLRRLLLLLLLGGLHFTLVWNGDIISLYAPLGMLLLPLLLTRLSPARLTLLAGGLGVWWLGLRVADALGAAPGPRWSFVLPLPPSTSYPDLLRLRAGHFPAELLDGGLYNLQWLLALLLLGMAAQRSGLLARPREHRRLLSGLALGSLLMGLPLSGLLAWLNSGQTQAAGLWEVPVRMSSGLALALGYVGLIGRALAAGGGSWMRSFAAPGRLALSNYISQSLVMTTLFYPYGLGLYGGLGAAGCLGLALLLGGLQLILSGLILRRFRAGPLEWGLRRLVYGGRRRE